jgi:hypothetical protein
MRRALKRLGAGVRRIPVGARIAALLLFVAGAAVTVALIRDDDSHPRGEVSAANQSSTYLGPKGGGHTWVRSRSKERSVVWALGDGADGGPEGRAVAGMIGARRVDRFLYLGDVYPSGTAREFERNYAPLYGGFDRIAAPTIGNHEWANVATGYVPYWTAAKGTPPPLRYAFAVSGWQLIGLNSNAPQANSPQQLGWLERTIERAPRYGTCRIAFMHHPIFSAGIHGDLSALQPIFTELRDHASIVLSGHDHDMQRLKPVAGITQLVDGSGGAELYPVNRDDTRLAFYDDTHHGAIRLKLRPERAVISFVASDGSLLDRSAVGCKQS